MLEQATRLCRSCGVRKEDGAFSRGRAVCKSCRAEVQRRSRRTDRVQTLLEEAGEYERKAAAGGVMANYFRETAAVLRRDAEREL